jgi:GTPase
VLLNKADADPDTAEIVRPDIEAAGWEVIVGSAVTGQGMDRCGSAWRRPCRRLRDEEPADGPSSAAACVRSCAGGAGLRRGAGRRGFRVTGPRVERWVAMTDLSNDQAVRYLQAQRLARAGVERALVAAGARRGDTIEIAGIAFDFDSGAR